QVASFEFRNQSSWYQQAYALIRVAKLAYVLGHPLSETQTSLRHAVDAFRQLFSLRGQSFCIHTKYRDGKPVGEEKVFDDGYSSVESFLAALVCLVVHDIPTARVLVDLAGPSPNAQHVSPKSEICTSNQQTLSHALNAILARDFQRACDEAR